jgi:hypothetical protein
MRPVHTETGNAQHQHSEQGDIQQRVNHTPPKRIAICGYDLSQARKIPGGNSGAAGSRCQ